MKLVTGGAFQGKLNYAKETFQIPDGWLDGAVCTEQEIYSARGVCHFNLLLRRMLEEKADVDGLPGRLAEKNPDICIVTSEMGCGVVPVDAFERLWREKTGRVCTELAKQSKEVHRVFCGIGMVIKK